MIPKMTYGLDVWYTPPHKEQGKKRNSGSVKYLKEFGKLQHLVTLAITGAFCTTPTDLLDAHAGLLQMKLLLKKICHQAATHICSLPLTNPVAIQAQAYHDCPASKHPTNIQCLLKIFNLDPLAIEKIQASTKPPNHRLPIDTISSKYI